MKIGALKGPVCCLEGQGYFVNVVVTPSEVAWVPGSNHPLTLNIHVQIYIYIYICILIFLYVYIYIYICVCGLYT